jgi:hypothetical protein
MDDRLENADWTKRTWDCLFITSVEQLRTRLRGKGRTVEEYKRLPVYKWAIINDDPPWMKDL